MPQLEELAEIAFMAGDAPASERHDARAEAYKQIVTGGYLPPQDDVVESLPYLAKASPIEPYWEQYTVGSRQTPTHTAVLMLNEYGLVERGSGNSRYLEKGYAGGFRFLRDVAQSVDIVQAIIRTRDRQVKWFLVPERDEGSPGFRFERTDGEKLSEDDKKEVEWLENFIMNSGDEFDPCRRDRLRRKDLEGFVTNYLWDSLQADACPVELVRTNGGKLTGWHNIDFETIRLCTESGYDGDDEIRAVQLIDNIPQITFTYEDILYDIRTPRTDLRAGGYGFAETEGIMRALTGYIDTVTYNISGVSRSAVPRGVLNIFGEYDNPQQQNFTRQMRAMLAGAAQRHNLPTLFSKSKDAGVQWTPIDTFEEMFFARLITLEVSITCAQYGIDPSEIAFDSFSTRSAALGGKADTEEKLSHSYDKGFIPTLRFVEKGLGRLVALSRLGKKYRFKFVGIDQEDKDKKHELIKLASTVDEIREMNGQDPHENELIGKAPTNPTLVGLYQQDWQMKQQAAMGPQPGDDQGDDQYGDPNAAGGQDEDYPQDALGGHNPYGQDPNGGQENEPPEDEHMHTLEFGKAVSQRPTINQVRRRNGHAPLPAPRRRFSAIIDRGSREDLLP